MKTAAALVKMKLAVDGGPSVNIITPGWIGAEAAGAQGGAACTADGAAPKPIASAAMAVVATATSRRIVPLPTEYLPIEPAGEGFALDLRFPSEGASSGRDGSLHGGLHQCQIRRQEVAALLAVVEGVQPLGQRRADPGGLSAGVGELGGGGGGGAGE